MNFIGMIGKALGQLASGRKLAHAAVLAVAFGLGAIAQAHHSFATFDFSKTVTIEGNVKDFQWTNPHVWIDVVVLTPEGTSRQYGVEAVAIPVLKGIGWKFNTLKPGDRVTIVMNPLRSGAPGGSLVSAKLPDGRTLSGK